MSAALVAFPLLLVAAVANQDAAAPVVDSSTTTVAEAERFRLLVLEPTAPPEERTTAQTIGSLIAVELSSYPFFDVVTSADVKQMMELEADRSAVGCTDSSCLAEIAGAMGANLVVFGDVGKLGSLLILNLNLFDSDKARAIGRVSVQTKSVEELPGKLSPALKKLVDGFARDKGLKLERSVGAAPHEVSPTGETKAETKTATAEADSGKASATSGTATASVVDGAPQAEGGGSILPLALVGVGGAVTAVGLGSGVALAVIGWAGTFIAVEDAAAAISQHDKAKYDVAKEDYDIYVGMVVVGAVGGGIITALGLASLAGGGAMMVMGDSE